MNSDKDSQKSGDAKDGEEQKESEEDEDNYMEMYVQDQFKEKLEPINEQIENIKTDLETKEAKMKEIQDQFFKYDFHYTMVLKAMLQRMGI